MKFQIEIPDKEFKRMREAFSTEGCATLSDTELIEHLFTVEGVQGTIFKSKEVTVKKESHPQTGTTTPAEAQELMFNQINGGMKDE